MKTVLIGKCSHLIIPYIIGYNNISWSPRPTIQKSGGRSRDPNPSVLTPIWYHELYLCLESVCVCLLRTRVIRYHSIDLNLGGGGGVCECVCVIVCMDGCVCVYVVRVGVRYHPD